MTATATVLARPEGRMPVGLHHPSCPNADKGATGVAQWSGAQLDDVLAGSLVFDGCGFCRKFFPAEPPAYDPPPAVLTSEDQPEPDPVVMPGHTITTEGDGTEDWSCTCGTSGSGAGSRGDHEQENRP